MDPDVAALVGGHTHCAVDMEDALPVSQPITIQPPAMGTDKKSVKTRDPRGRNWCFTDYDVSSSLGSFLPTNVRDKVRYIIRQRERCPNSGREHYQGWLQLSEHQSMAWLKKNISVTAHFESCRGSEAANDKYCSKLKSQIGQPESFGSYKKQGSCATNEELAQLVMDGKSMVDLCTTAPSLMLMHCKKVLDFRLMMNPPKTRKFMKIFFLYGEPGSNKSPYADALYPRAYTMHDHYAGWADGYDGEETIIIDEFTGLYPLPLLLQLCDSNKLRLPVKGGFVACCATTVVFIGYTLHPMLYYNGDPAWVKRMNKYGYIVRMKADKTNWRQVEEVDYDARMWPPAAPEGQNFLSSAGAGEVTSPPGAVVLPKEVRGTGHLQESRHLNSMRDDSKTTMVGDSHLGSFSVNLNPHVWGEPATMDDVRRQATLDNLLAMDSKMPLAPPPLVRQVRMGRRNAEVTVGDVFAAAKIILPADLEPNSATISCSDDDEDESTGVYGPGDHSEAEDECDTQDL